MYNLTTNEGATNDSTTPCAPCNVGGTDGWVWGFQRHRTWLHQLGCGLGGHETAPNTTPFGYNGNGVLHWGLHMTTNGEAEISSQDSVDRYGVGADIDTAKGAWSDTALSGAQGWRHDLDFGLFKSDVGGTITLNAVAINGSTPTSTPNSVLPFSRAWIPTQIPIWITIIMAPGTLTTTPNLALQPRPHFLAATLTLPLPILSPSASVALRQAT